MCEFNIEVYNMAITYVNLNRPTRCGGMYKEIGYTVRVRDKSKFFSIPKYGEQLAFKKAKAFEEQRQKELILEGKPLRFKSKLQSPIPGLTLVYLSKDKQFKFIIRLNNDNNKIVKQINLTNDYSIFEDVVALYKLLATKLNVAFDNNCTSDVLYAYYLVRRKEVSEIV